MKSRLLIVDDDQEIGTQMKWALNQEYEVLLAPDRPAALEYFRSHLPQVTLLDLGLPPHAGTPEEGLAALSEMLALDSLAKVIVISGQSEKTNALQAVGAGAYDFLTKPIDLEELKIVLKRAFHIASLERDYSELQKQLQTDTFEGMMGASGAIQKVFELIRKVATTDAPVLLLGESGTGKEMAARAIHRLSSRNAGPFLAINCSAIPEALLESELFGHEKGSFTGAHVQRKGRIESASRGTLFLDEIGEIPLQTQVKLLRFLQEQRIERIGGREEIQVDTRIVAATNADLKKAITEGKFREDLFYRLAVVVVGMPPLREREGDVRLLAQEFLRRNAESSSRQGLSFGRDAVRALLAHSWPGNVRELENRVKRAVIMAEGKRITAKNLELEAPINDSVALNLKQAREAAERDAIERSLRKHRGKISPAAAELGISRPTMYELLEKLGICRAEQNGNTADQ